MLAIALGHRARKEIKNSNGTLRGDGLALAGLVIGYIGIGVAVLGIIAAIALPKITQ